MDLSVGGRIPICMKCGSRAIHHQTRGEGLWAAGGEGVAWVCEDCHHIGAPFLADRRPDGEPGADWTAEFEAAAFQLEDEAWSPPARSRRDHLLGAAFILVGGLFLVPVATALYRVTLSGVSLSFLWALTGTGWLLAIGLALILVGVRRIRRAGQDPEANEDEARDGAPSAVAAPDDPIGDRRDPTGPDRQYSSPPAPWDPRGR